MKIDTRYFGEVEIGEEKIIHFEKGIPGFDEYKDYTVLYDIDGEGEPFFSWLQSITEKSLAFPVVNPFRIAEDYNPVVEDALLEEIGKCDMEDLVLFLLATVPENPENATVNMKAPLLINSKSRQGMQIIVENEDYEIRHRIMKEKE